MTALEIDFSQLQTYFAQLSPEHQRALCANRAYVRDAVLKPQLAALRTRFADLKPGAQADLRKNDWREFDRIPAYYQLHPPVPEAPAWQRTAHFLAIWKHLELRGPPGDALGTALARAEIHERRLFQLVRSDPPTDLDTLRRILQQKPAVAWEALGMAVYFWNDNQKQRILKDYFLAAQGRGE